MAFQLGLPILSLKEEGVLAEGVLERGVTGLYLQSSVWRMVRLSQTVRSVAPCSINGAVVFVPPTNGGAILQARSTDSKECKASTKQPGAKSFHAMPILDPKVGTAPAC